MQHPGDAEETDEGGHDFGELEGDADRCTAHEDEAEPAGEEEGEDAGEEGLPGIPEAGEAGGAAIAAAGEFGHNHVGDDEGEEPEKVWGEDIASDGEERGQERSDEEEADRTAEGAEAGEHGGFVTAALHKVFLGGEDHEHGAFVRGAEEDGGDGVQHCPADDEAHEEGHEDRGIAAEGGLGNMLVEDEEEHGDVVDVEGGEAADEGGDERAGDGGESDFKDDEGHVIGPPERRWRGGRGVLYFA